MTDLVIIPTETLRTLISEVVREELRSLQNTEPLSQAGNDEYLTEKELQIRFGWSHATIHRMRMQGKLPYRKMGRTIRFCLNEVLEAMKQQAELFQEPKSISKKPK